MGAAKQRRLRRAATAVGLLLATALLAWAAPPAWQQSFETPEPTWRAGWSDTPHRVQTHTVSTSSAHSGQQSEYLRLTAEQGAHIHFWYPLGRVELLDDLQVMVWLRANRPGMRLLVRVVLPHERDRQHLDQPLTTLLSGDRYEWTGRWQQLQLREPMRRFQEQLQLLRADLGRDINTEGAYVDQVVLNVYGGVGLHEVWIDDLEVGPQPPALGVGGDGAVPARTTQQATVPVRAAQVELSKDRLLVNQRPFLMRGTRWAGRSPRELRDQGFNVLWVDAQTPPAVLAEAERVGMLLVPEIPEQLVAQTPTGGGVHAALTRFIRDFAHSDAVLAWQVGSGLTQEQTPIVHRAAQLVRRSQTPADRLIAGGVWDGLRGHSRSLDLLGLYRWPLATGLDLAGYRDWLQQRLLLAEPAVFAYTWVQTHWPAGVRAAAGDGVEARLAAALGPQPEQVKLLTYLALAAGCRGVAFWDEAAANEPPGRARHLALALVNLELELLEPMLASRHAGDLLRTRHPEIRVAVMRFDGGLLALPLWLGSGAQHVAGQLTLPHLDLVIPGAPRDAQAWLVSPVAVQPLPQERVPGGVRVVIPEFAMSAALVFTADMTQIARLQQFVMRRQRQAAQWSYELAWEQVRLVETVQQQLAELGQAHPSTPQLLADARRHLGAAFVAWRRGNVTDLPTVYEEAERAQRSLRLLMRSQWERAARTVDMPTCSPFMVGYATLPRHYRFVNEVKACQNIPNVLADGDFEASPEQTLPGWTIQAQTLDDVHLHLARVTEQPRQGRQCLKLEITAKQPAQAPLALERTYLALTSPKFDLHPGMLVRVSGWIRIPQPIQASVDGALFFDSLGGEPLAVRLTGPTPWKPFSLYRRVPPSGQVSVTMALTGIGTVYFDDVRIEPLAPAATTPAADRTSSTPNPPGTPTPARGPEAATTSSAKGQ